MSYIQFESGLDKEKARQELREIRAELLTRAENNAKLRHEKEIQKKLRGDDQWMLPDVAKKISNIMDSSSSKHKNKSKSKSKKNKKEKKSSSKKSKRKNLKKKKRKHRSSGSSSSSSSRSNSNTDTDRNTSETEDEWVEKHIQTPKNEIPKTEIPTSKTSTGLVRDDWLAVTTLPVFSKNKQIKTENTTVSYDPSSSCRELNPYWKNGGQGLPNFQKPSDDITTNDHLINKNYDMKFQSGNWKKNKNYNESSSQYVKNKSVEDRKTYSRKRSRSSSNSSSPSKRSRSKSAEKLSSPKSKSNSRDNLKTTTADNSKIVEDNKLNFLTDQQMNELGAKIIKAEIMGNNDLANKLKVKLEKAREYRNTCKDELISIKQNNASKKSEDVLLTISNANNVSRPLSQRDIKPSVSDDRWGGRKHNKKSSNKKIETHVQGERVKYFPDDDKYDIKQMFEKEKFESSHEQDEQFMNIAGKYKSTKDDLEDLFTDEVTKTISNGKINERERNRAIQEYNKMASILDTCDKCFDSTVMNKQLIVAMGTNVYLSVPSHESLQTGHCLIIPMRHSSCSTQLDEDIWNEIQDFRKAVTRMFTARSQDVIFFETANYLHKKPHMVIHCVPNKNFELAPFYFKKAILESEMEWSTNKQLIDLKNKDIRHAVPKGLPYFWVNFGMDSGFAHVIEDQHRIPHYFAQEIIGGLLNLNSRLWRHPRKEDNIIVKVKQFADWWRPFNIT